MKKFLLLLVGVLSCLSANAYTSVYLRGDWKDGWGTSGTEMTTHDGVNYFINGVSMKSENTFKVYYDNNWYGSGGSINVNTDYTLSSSGGNSSASSSFSNATVIFNKESSHLYIFVPSTSRAMYLRGSATNNFAAQDAYKMTTTDGKVYTLNNVTLSSGDRFVLSTDSWNPRFGGKDKDGTAVKLGENNVVYREGNDYHYTVSSNMSNVNLSFDVTTQKLTITQAEYHYSIHHNFNDGSSNNWKETVFTKVDDTTYQTSVTFPQAGGNFGIRVATDEACNNQLTEGGWYVVNSSSTSVYDIANGAQTFNLVADGGTDLSIKDYSSISGDVTFTLTVDATTKKPTSLTITGGKVAAPSYTYSIYGNMANGGNSWSDNWMTKNSDGTYSCTVDFDSAKGGKFGVKVAIESSQKYWYRPVSGSVSYSAGKTYDLYEEKTSGTANFDFDYANISGKLTFTLTVDENNLPVSLKVEEADEADASVYIYMHFKEDYLKEGAETIKPGCHIWRMSNNQACYSYGTDDESMELVPEGKIGETYQLWRYKVPADWVNFTDCNVEFYFKDKYNSSDSSKDRQYEAGNAMDKDEEGTSLYDSKNWTKYIYATAVRNKKNKAGQDVTDEKGNKITIPYACQSYLTYGQFLEKLGQPRDTAYVVGSPKMDIDPKLDGNSQSLPDWKIAAPVKVPADDGCFYLKLTPHFNDAGTVNEENNSSNNNTYKGYKQVGFKVSWIDPVAAMKAAKPTAPYNELESRLWATYDLGIIGVADTRSDITKFTALVLNGQLAIFKTNKSIPYIYYNQYNWTLVKSSDTSTTDDPATDGLAKDGKPYYAVFDSHPECRSVTLCSFDPNPGVQIQPSKVEPYDKTLSDYVAKKITTGDYFRGSHGDNEDLAFTDVNVGKCDAVIKATSIDKVMSSGFEREYLVTINDVTALDATGNADGTTWTLNSDNEMVCTLDYLPVGTDENGDYGSAIKIRACFTDNASGVTFHSRTGKGTFNEPTYMLDAPKVGELKGTFIFNRVDENNKQVYDLYVTGLTGKFEHTYQDGSVSTKLNAYGDYKFFLGDDSDNPLETALIQENDDNYKKLKDLGVKNVQGASLQNGQNWSQYLMEATGTNFPVLVKNAAYVDSPTDLEVWEEAHHVNARVYSVMPFIYTTNSQAKAPRRKDASAEQEQAQEEMLQQYNGHYINTVRKSTTKTVSPEFANTVSGIEAVNADAQDLYAPVEYYTISGVRVSNNPGPGIYIRRQGNTVTKVAIR